MQRSNKCCQLLTKVKVKEETPANQLQDDIISLVSISEDKQTVRLIGLKPESYVVLARLNELHRSADVIRYSAFTAESCRFTV